VVLLTMATANALVGFGALPVVVVGCALFGLSMAGWMLPLSVLRRETPPEHVAWRTGLYRVCVDGGIFLGPFLSGALGMHFAEFLGPCSEANVVFVYLHQRALWFKRVNTLDLFEKLLAYVRTAVDAPGAPLPDELAARSFSWTGGGLGPAPA